MRARTWSYWITNFTPWNVSDESTIAAIGGGMAIALFSYIGVETVASPFTWPSAAT